MFKLGDIVQSKTGGPRMRVLNVEHDRLYCARIDDPIEKEVEISVDSVSLYREEGNFGVC